MLADLVKSLYGTLRLAKGDRRGLAYFDGTPEGARRSFSALFLTLPLWLLIIWPGNDAQLQTLGITAQEFATVSALQMLTTLLFFFLVVERLSLRMGCRSRFPLYVSAQNWAGIVVVALMLALHFSLGDLPYWTGRIADVLTILLSWFITLSALRVTPVVAFGLCVLEVLAQQLVALGFALVIGISMNLAAGAPA